MTTTYDDIKGTWHSSQASFGGFAEEVVLDIGRENVVVTADGEYKGGGHYTIAEDVAVFGWSIDLCGEDILFLDAMLTDKVLFVRWKPIEYWYPYTSGFERE